MSISTHALLIERFYIKDVPLRQAKKPKHECRRCPAKRSQNARYRRKRSQARGERVYRDPNCGPP